MSQHSDIQWTDATWNPTRGCSRVSEGCRHCYAEGIAFRFSGEGKPFEGFAKVTAPRDVLDKVGGRRNGWTGRVELIADKLTEPLSWRKPQKVFVNSMSDLFHENLPDEAIDQVFAVMALAYRHTFQVLTKRADRMRDYLSTHDVGLRWLSTVYRKHHGECVDDMAFQESDAVRWTHDGLPNVWLGVSVENQHFADERIPLLLQTPAAVRFISAEPLLERVLLDNGDTSWLTCTPQNQQREAGDCCMGFMESGRHFHGIDWVIVGGESGHGSRPFDLAWARSIVEQCQSAGVSVFVKQLGAKPILDCPTGEEDSGQFRDDGSARYWTIGFIKDRKGSDMAEWPEDLRIREFPEVRA